MREPLSHRFTIDQEAFLLVEPDHGGEEEIQNRYALSIAIAPDVLNALYYEDRYAKAVAAVCLKEAPAWCWEERVTTAQGNGSPRRVLNLAKSDRRFWPKLRKEVDAFLVLLQDDLPATPEAPPPAVPGDAPPVALVEALPPALQGRAV
jgi:hypothetical protein